MTISRAIELAMAEVLRAYTNIGEGAVIRAWQSLTDDQVIAIDGQKEFPMVDIRCSPPATDDQVTRYCDVQLLCGTYNEDDKNHSKVADLYEAVQTALDLLHDQFFGTAGDAYNLFVTNMAELAEDFTLGGFTFAGSEPPYEDGAVNLIAVNIRVHYSTPIT